MKKSFIAAAAMTLAVFGLGSAQAATIVTMGTTGTDGVTALYPSVLSQNTTGSPNATFLGRPNDSFQSGIGGQIVTYDFAPYRIINGPGFDLNIYELDRNVVEFSKIQVFASLDNLFFALLSSFGSKLNLAGDETHSNPAFARGYDLGALTAARYIRIDGIGNGGVGSERNEGFDLDAIGAANFRAVPGPIAGAGLPALMALGGFVWARRRKTAVAGA